MRVVTREPAAPLAPFVTSLAHYTGEIEHARERIIPSGTMQLLINLHEDEFRTYHGDAYAFVRRVCGAAIQGAQARPTVIDPRGQRSVVVIGFRPGGSAPFFAPPASALTDDLVGLDELWGRDGAVLHDRLRTAASSADMLRTVESILLERAVRPLEPDPGLGYAVRALGTGTPVAAVTDELGTTPKRLIARFADQIGLTPKRFARVRRFQRLLASIPVDRPVDWAGLAAANGFFDQSHLIHEFRALAGTSPTCYRPRSPGEQNHLAL